ncbi:hypothetical protein BKM15_25880 [Pseudomonas syringae pv. syringae]|nr:hypothetical protein BKM15_25880 [Pseudomonas syringae pv. syringae]
MINYRVERAKKEIIYHIQTKLGLQLPEDVIWDIDSNVQKATEVLQKEIDRFWEENHALRWNELGLELRKLKQWKDTEKADVYDQVLGIMRRLDEKESIR